MAHSYRKFHLFVLLLLLAAMLPQATPALAATIIVTNTNDSGAGSLRQALIDANSGDTITFSVSGTILLASPLPTLTKGGITIDAGTAHNIVIDGSALTGSNVGHGLKITSANNTIKGLVIINVPSYDTAVQTGGSGIYIGGSGATGNRVSNCYLGVQTNGTDVARNGNFGILIDDGANGNIIGRDTSGVGEPNVISGNRTANVALTSASGGKVTNNQIRGNRIGTNASGTAAITGADSSRFDAGVFIENYAEENVIEGNVISGNVGSNAAGIKLSSTDSSGTNAPRNNRIVGNYIGINASGTAAIPNSIGISFKGVGGSTGNIIGEVGNGNYISGNSKDGILFDSSRVGNTTVAGNWIGLKPDGTPLGNGQHGVYIFNTRASGGITIGPGNVITANNDDGVRIVTNNNVVKGNYISTNKDGSATTLGYANGGYAVYITKENQNFNATGNLIGGPTAADRNIIGLKDAQTAVRVNASNNTVQGNYIGVNVAGTAGLLSLPSDNSIGLEIYGYDTTWDVDNITIADNVVSALDVGIKITGPSSGNVIRGNKIGTNAAGTGDLGHRSDGIYMFSGTTNTTIGGTSPGDGNIIAYNGKKSVVTEGTTGWYYGIFVTNTSTTNNTIVGNQVFNNARSGVYVKAASKITISKTETTANGNGNGDGIMLTGKRGSGDPGNIGLAAPTNLSISNATQTLSGTACAGCTIEVFTTDAAEDREGPEYLTSGTANDTGSFAINVLGCKDYLTATATDANGNTSAFSNSTTIICETPDPPDVSLSAGTPPTSAGSPQLVNPGTQVTYQHTLQNTGDLAGDFTITATSSQGWNVQVNPTSVNLIGGASTTISVTVTVPANAAPNLVDELTVTASVGSKSQSRINYTKVNQVYGVDIKPDTPQSGAARPGDFVDYEHTITNTGNGQDTITLTNSAPGNGITITFPNGNSCTLNAGESCTRTVRVAVAENSTATTETTIVTATSSNGTTKDTATDITTVVRAATIIPGAQLKSALPGATVVFTHTVENTGDVARNLTLSVTGLPTGWTATLNTPTLSLTPGQTAPVTLTVTLPLTASAPDAGTQETATIKVTPDGAEDLAVTALDTVEVLLKPEFTFTVATQPSVNAFPGQTVVFTHTLTNLANGSDTFTITPDVSTGLTLLSITPENPIQLARNGSTQVIVRARVNNGTLEGPQTIQLTAATASTPTPAPISRTDTVNVQGAAIPDLSDGLTLNTDPGATAIFTHTLTNIGNKTGTFTVPLPTLPAGWSAVLNNPSNCLGSLAAGSTCVFGIAVTVDSEAGVGPTSFQVTASSSDGSDTITDTVNVNAVPGLEFTPDRDGTADPGKSISYQHTLTNTGNGPDTFTVTLTTDPGWQATVTPTIISDLARDTPIDVTVTVTAPTGVVAGTVGTVTATARSALSPNPQANVVDTTTVNAVPGAELIPPEQSTFAQPKDDQPVTVTFFHTLRNSGSTVISYTLTTTGDSPGWTSVVSPTETSALVPGATTTISVSVTMPAGTTRDTENVTTVLVQERDGPGTILAQAADTTIAGAQFGVLLEPPVNYGTAFPGTTRAYTHTLTNIGTSPDIFLFSTVNNFGWETTVSPSSIELPAGAKNTITVTVRIPTTALSDTVALPPNIATIIARSNSDPTIFGSAEEQTSVLQVAGVSLSPGQFSAVSPRSNVITFKHTLLNTGNGVDTFTLTATSDLGWSVTVTPAEQALAVGRSYPVEVRVQVPSNIPPGTISRVRVTATSRSDPRITGTIENVLRYTSDAPTEAEIYLPLIRR